MFILDWINDYINTPQIEMTTEIELLFYCAVAIISVLVMIGMAGICGICYLIKKLFKTIKRRKNNVFKKHK